MTTSTPGRPATAPAALRVSVLGIGALVVLKFLVLLAEYDWDLTRSPYMLLVLIAVPVAIISLSAGRAPRTAAAVALPLLVLFVAVVVSALARDGLVRQSWSDYPFAYGGLVLALWAGRAAVRMLRRR